MLGYGSLPDADCAAAGERLKKLCTAAREASDTLYSVRRQSPGRASAVISTGLGAGG